MQRMITQLFGFCGMIQLILALMISSPQSITMDVSIHQRFSGKLTCIYAKCTRYERKDLWNHITQISSGIDVPGELSGERSFIAVHTSISQGLKINFVRKTAKLLDFVPLERPVTSFFSQVNPFLVATSASVIVDFNKKKSAPELPIVYLV